MRNIMKSKTDYKKFNIIIYQLWHATNRNKVINACEAKYIEIRRANIF